MEDFSRIFPYSGQNKAFNVFFYIEDGRETLPLRMHTINLTSTNLGFPKTEKLLTQIGKAFKESYFSLKPIIRRIYCMYSILYKRRRKNSVLFMSEQNTEIISNLKAVSEQMKQRNLDKEFHILYSARKFSADKRNLKVWFKELKALSQSGTIFIDDHAPLFDWLKLDKDQRVIQLWHAGAGFKSSGYSRWGHLGCPAPQSCHRQYTYGISGSKNIAHFFSEVWGINDENVLPTGMPRMDEYLDENHKKQKIAELYEQFPICKGKKVILFAPTYRGKNNKDAYYPYELIDFENLYNICGDEYVILFKMHPWVIKDISIGPKYQDKFLDVKTYPKINDLFYIVDLLITDYSSNIFEYSLMRKPMLFLLLIKFNILFLEDFIELMKNPLLEKYVIHLMKY
ncbi:putative polyribitolphosphotransferase [Lachnospiraceae bacterium TWA4]|nr:putative polyribitolphosphotransferase [Lachnospiraceae bacterium TWA4]